jgi:hypothetical protein
MGKEKSIQNFNQNLEGRGHLEDLEVDERTG